MKHFDIEIAWFTKPSNKNKNQLILVLQNNNSEEASFIKNTHYLAHRKHCCKYTNLELNH